MYKLFLYTLAFLVCSSASASLMISPTRVVLENRDRSAKVTLINSGTETRSYRVEWEQRVALPNGGYRALTAAEKQNYSGLERIVRISPKQVTIAPGQSQSIKLLLRKKGKMTDGEYRSHLKFTALPKTQTQPQKKGTGIKLNLLMSYTIPVIYRSGNLAVNPSISNLSIATKQNTGKTFIRVQLSHRDKYSASGRLVAYWTPRNGARTQVGVLNGVNFYPEVLTNNIEIFWKNFKLEPGVLDVRYEGRQEFSGQLLASKRIEITDEIIKSAK